MSVGTFIPKETNKKNTMVSVSLNILTSPSQLLSHQSFAITITPKLVLLSGDYLVVEMPRLYSFSGSVLTVLATTNLISIASDSLCVESDYFCSHYASDPYRIKVQEFSTTFSSTAAVTVTIKNNLYYSPSTFSFSGYYFKAASYGSNNLGIDETVTPTTNLTNS